MKTIAYFISSHGFGHATRSAAVMEAMQALEPGLRFEIFSQVPVWLFQESLAGSFGYHPLLTDIGLVQKNSLVEDLPQTINRLNHFLPFKPRQIQNLARQVNELDCQLLVCDISPMGIVVAHAAGVPAVLVENFTWDWIYQGYPDFKTHLSRHISYLQDIFEMADYHIQTEPVCHPQRVDLTTTPVSRKVRATLAQIRQKLGLPSPSKMVVVTMGGMEWDYTALEQVKNQADLHLVIAGSNRQRQNLANLIHLPRDSGIFHPDLINACDAIVGKVGYSTLAEVYQAGVPFGYLARPEFRESPALVDYIEVEMSGLPLTETQLQSGKWLSSLVELLALPRIQRDQVNGADQIARFICDLLI